MKAIYYLIACTISLLFVFSIYAQADCQSHDIKHNRHSVPDSIIIDTETNYKIAKADIPSILKQCPEFKFKELINSPDITLAEREYSGFDCEACQDNYFRLYAYFLQQVNGGKKYETSRQRLIKIYRTINGIYEGLSQVGTYFGHMHLRIHGYAEYTIYLGKENGLFKQPYGIIHQRLLYIQEIKQLIIDEVKANNEMTAKEKTESKRKLFKYANRLNKLLSNYFYLESARNFQYSNYQYTPIHD